MAWIGYPSDLAGVLQKMVADTWDNREELAQRNLHKYLAALDDSISDELFIYRDLPGKP